MLLLPYWYSLALLSGEPLCKNAAAVCGGEVNFACMRDCFEGCACPSHKCFHAAILAQDKGKNRFRQNNS